MATQAVTRVFERHAAPPAIRLPFRPVQSEAGRYAPRRNLPAIAVVIAIHGALLAALLTTGTITTPKSGNLPIVIDAIPIAEPLMVEPRPTVTLEKVEAEIFAPDVIVEAPPVLSPVMTTTAPSVPTATSALPPASTLSAPTIPPDFTADQLDNPAPRYPMLSRRNHEEGTVELKVLVSTEGRTQDVTVAKSSGFARLDKAALEAVRGWRFRPASRAGQPVAAWVIVPIPFVLS